MSAPAFDLDRPWRLGEQVALRPEPFGALAYHFGTRRLSFLKSRRLLAVVEGLGQQPSGRAACAAAGVGEAELPAYAQALATLAETGMICVREGADRGAASDLRADVDATAGRTEAVAA